MLDLMRKHSKSWLTAVIIGCIAMVFIFWGVSSTWNQPAAKNLKINGEVITQADIDLTAKIMVLRQQMRFGPALNKELLDQMVNERTVVRAAVNDRLMQQAANKWGLYASDAALSRLIGSDPLFQNNGRFDLEFYRYRLASLNTNEINFENHARRQLAASLTSNILASLASVTPGQIRERYHLLNDQIRVEYLFFGQSGFQEGLTASEEELNDFFQKNGARWRLPARIKVNLVHLNAGDLLDQEEVQVSEDEVRRFYEDNPGRFQSPPRAEIAHLLLLLPSAQPTGEQLAELKQKAQDLLERAQTEDFASLVSEYSQDKETASSGGNLGWHSPGELTPAINELIFPELAENQSYPEPGAILGPVRGPFGYHLLKVLAREPAKLTTFAEAQEALQHELKLNKARNLAWNTMLTIQDDARISQDLDLSAEAQGLKTTLTDWFTLDDPDPALKEGLDKLLAAAFQSAQGDILDVAEREFTDDFYLIKIADREEPVIPPLDEVKAEALEAWKEHKANELALAAARDFLAQAQKVGWNKAKDDFLAARDGRPRPVTGLTEPFGRLDEIAAGIDLGLAVFQLGQVGQWADHPAPSAAPDQAGWYVLRLNKIEPADEQSYENQKDLWLSQIEREKAMEFIEAWLKRAWAPLENKKA